MKSLSELAFVMFVVVKVWGTIFAAWSWWWVLCPLAPWIYVGLQHAGVL